MLDMSKSIKLKDNNYLDSTGITHNRNLLSTILNKLTYNSGWTRISTDYGVYYKKVGNIVTVRGISSGSRTLSGWSQTFLGNLPADYRPNTTIRYPVYAKGSTSVYGQVSDAGNVIYFNWAGSATFDDGALAFTVTYVVD